MKKTIRILQLLIIILLSPYLIPAQAMDIEISMPDYDPLWKSAEKLWEKRHNDLSNAVSASKIFEQLAGKYPEKSEPHEWLCRCFYFLTAFETGSTAEQLCVKSEKAGLKALSINPDNPRILAWTALAICYNRVPSELEDRIKKQLTIKNKPGIRELPVPDTDPAWQDFILSWDKRQDRANAAEALSIMRSLYKKYPDSRIAIMWMARVLYYMGFSSKNKKEAIQFHREGVQIAEKAWKMTPYDPAALFWYIGNIGRYVDEESVWTKLKYSKTIFEGMKRMTSDGPFYYYSAVHMYVALALSRGSWVSATFFKLRGFSPEQVARAVTVASWIFPDFLNVQLARGEVYMIQKKYDSARKDFEYIINHDPAADTLHTAENIIAREQAKIHLGNIPPD